MNAGIPDRQALGGVRERSINGSEDNVDVFVAKRGYGGPLQISDCRGPDSTHFADALVLEFEFDPGEGGTGDLKEEFTKADDCRLRVRGHRSFGGSWRSD